MYEARKGPGWVSEDHQSGEFEDGLVLSKETTSVDGAVMMRGPHHALLEQLLLAIWEFVSDELPCARGVTDEEKIQS